MRATHYIDKWVERVPVQQQQHRLHTDMTVCLRNLSMRAVALTSCAKNLFLQQRLQ
jgi:hypothetical protein